MRTWVAASLLLLRLTGMLVADTRRLELTLIDRTRLPHDVLQILRSEVEEIWRGDLSLEWVAESGDHERAPAEHVYIVVCRRDQPKAPHGAIATIAFVGSDPMTQIQVHPAEALALLGEDPGLRYSVQPMKTRNAALGRVLGRAIAHEIGHFVKRSPRHSHSGLMKAMHPIAVLAGNDRSAFVVEQALAPSPTLLAINDCSIAEWLTNSQ